MLEAILLGVAAWFGASSAIGPLGGMGQSIAAARAQRQAAEAAMAQRKAAAARATPDTKGER